MAEVNDDVFAKVNSELNITFCFIKHVSPCAFDLSYLGSCIPSLCSHPCFPTLQLWQHGMPIAKAVLTERMRMSHWALK